MEPSIQATAERRHSLHWLVLFPPLNFRTALRSRFLLEWAEIQNTLRSTNFMRCTTETIPAVNPMMIRKMSVVRRDDGLVFESLAHARDLMGGTLIAHEVEIEEVGLADARLDFDADVVDCSNRVFAVTTEMMIQHCKLGVMIFPSRRWRNYRSGMEMTGFPCAEEPLLFLGNPIRIHVGEEGLTVIRESTYLIKSGESLGIDMTATNHEGGGGGELQQEADALSAVRRVTYARRAGVPRLPAVSR